MPKEDKGQETEVKVEETPKDLSFKQGIAEPPQPVTEPQAPSLEEPIDYKQKYEQSDKEARGAQARVTEISRQLKEKELTASRLDTIEDSMQILAGLIAKGGDIDPEHATSYKEEFAALKAKREQEASSIAQMEYNQKATAVFNKAKEEFPDDHTRLLRVERYLDRGLLADAEEIVATAGKKETKVESQEDLRQKWIEEGKRLAWEESGKLKSDTGGPSGATDDDQIRKNYRENPNDRKAYKAYHEWLSRQGG